MKFIASIALLFALFACFIIEIPHAIERQIQIDHDIKVSRCERSYMPGYCDDVMVAKK